MTKDPKDIKGLLLTSTMGDCAIFMNYIFF